jgi:sulfite reductase (ferredoxin)
MATTWKEKLAARTDPELAREIDIFEAQMELRKRGELEEKIFAEQRLRRGAYGQRYDNGQRHDGVQQQTIDFGRDLTKGPETFFDAPGMIRIKIPFGGLTAEQIDTMADLAEEYSVNNLHVTTRQDIQMHYIHIESAPDFFRRLGAVGITTREACGNAVRNVTACPYSGICTDETFDVTPYAKALMKFLLGHPDTMDFGRKFKPAFSGCKHHACGLVNMHDFGAVAVERTVNGQSKRGFSVYVGGGLGAVPHDAKLLDDFVPEEELLPVAQAIARVFARLGEKKNRARARIKFVVAKLGIEKFREEVLKEKATMPFDPRWTGLIEEFRGLQDKPLHPGKALNGATPPPGFAVWRATNVYKQRQPGYVAAVVTLPLGDFSSWQARRLADLARKYCGDTVRATVDQNLLFRFIPEADIVKFYNDLAAIGLADPGAKTIVDVTACPGTDSCKLGISSSRGLAAELRKRLTQKNAMLDEAIGKLHIKISGCFNSCGQHHIADIGFYGVNRNVAGRSVPHFQVILGGQWTENAASYGLAVAAIPSKNIPDVLDRITGRFARERTAGETFQAYIKRLGKRELKDMFDDLAEVPAHDVNPGFYQDWGDTREYTHGDRGKGECAGEVVSLVDFNLAESEREAFEASVLLEEGKFPQADTMAYQAMISAAKALVKTKWLDVPNDPDRVVSEFRGRFVDTKLFVAKFAGANFADYLFVRHARGANGVSREAARQVVEEAQLFIEAAHDCQSRMQKEISGIKV